MLRPFFFQVLQRATGNVSQKLGEGLIFKIRLQFPCRDSCAPKKLPEVFGGRRREFQSPGLERPVVKETIAPGEINQLSDPDLPGRLNSRSARLRNWGRRASFFGRFELTGVLTSLPGRSGKGPREM